MIIYIIIGFSIVVLLLVLFMFLILKKTVDTVSGQTKTYFVDKLQVYDDLINNTINVTNIHSFGVAAGFKYDYNKYITTQTGLGYTFNYSETYDSIDDALGAYLNVQIKVNKYFSIIPELSLFNNMQSNTKQSEGYSFMAGILMLLQI